MFKQLMQAGAIDFCQVDACRLGGLNEVLAVLLMAAKFGIPVCPHAGGLGLCEYVQHISLIDYICIGASVENRAIEFADKSFAPAFCESGCDAQRALCAADRAGI